jgi:hypothetical protein
MTKKAAAKNPVIDLTAFDRTESEKRPQEKKFDELFLDPENPRLAEIAHTGTQAAIQKAMEKEFDLQPLVDSLYRNGFFWEEPLVAVREPLTELRGREVLVVVEGNRRLAALKYIHAQPSNFPNAEARKRLDKVPVIVRDTRDETLSFVGFRHITGIVPWESAGKAQYAIRLINGGHTVDEIAQLIGNKTRDIERWIRTQSLIEKASEEGLTSDNTAKGFHFSYLLTASDAPATKKWLKLELDPKRATVKSVDGDRLKQLWTWLYGRSDTDISPAVAESRQIHKLNRILAVTAATRELEKTSNLERAFAYTKTREEYVSESLSRMRSDLQDVLATVSAEGPLKEDEKNKEYVASARKEFAKIESVLGALKNILGF